MLSAGCASQLQSGLPLPGLRLDAVGTELRMEWTPDSLVTRGLRAGTRLDIVAEYQTATGRVTGDAVGTAVVRAGQNLVQIALEPALRREPTGPVCLRVRLDGRMALPLRAGGSGAATDTFQHAAWARLAKANVARQEDLAERERAQKTLAALDRADSDHLRWSQQLGISSGEQCGQLALVAQDETPPASVVQPQAQQLVAQRDCAYRYRQLFGGDGNAPVEFAVEMERAFQAELRQNVARGSDLASARLQGVQNLMAVLTKFNAEIAQPGYRLALQLPESSVRLQLTSTADAELVLATKSKNFRKLYEPVLDAFGSCLVDTRAQLDLSYQSWVRERQLAPVVRQQRLDLARDQCRSRFQDADRRALTRAAVTRVLTARDATTVPSVGPISSEPLNLLRTGC